jgi:hypothetical protein
MMPMQMSSPAASGAIVIYHALSKEDGCEYAQCRGNAKADLAYRTLWVHPHFP